MVMQYYKYLNLDCSTVIKKLQEFVNTQPIITKIPWYTANLKVINFKIPELQELFNPLTITIKSVSFLTITGKGSIHIDDTTSQLRINIPVFNCDNTITRFFTTTTEPKKYANKNGVYYYAFNPDDCTLVDSYVLHTAVLLKVLEPHQIENFNENSPRVSCTVEFEEDLNHLLL